MYPHSNEDMMSLILNETLLFCIVRTLLNFKTNIPLKYVSIIAYCFQEDNLQQKHRWIRWVQSQIYHQHVSNQERKYQ